MTGIVEFVNDRLAEDEALARDAEQIGPWTVTQDGYLHEDGHGTLAVGNWQGPISGVEHIARHDPARTLRQTEANRELLTYCADELADDETSVWPALLLAHLAAVWSDHPDYRAEWQPQP